MKQQTKDKVLEQIQKQRRSQSRQKDHTLLSLEFQGIVIEEFTPSIDEYLKNFNNLEHLQFRKCKIRSLSNLSDYTKVTYLDLEENQLDESSLKHIVQHFPSLRFLNLRKNQIKDISEFEHFKTLTQLTHLQLEKNPLTDTQEVWNWIPNLKALDGYDQNGKIVRDSDDSEDDEEEDVDDDESFSVNEDEDEDYESEDDASSSSNKKKKKKVKK